MRGACIRRIPCDLDRDAASREFDDRHKHGDDVIKAMFECCKDREEQRRNDATLREELYNEALRICKTFVEPGK